MRREIDDSILEMALIGYSARRDEIVQKISAIESQLGVRSKRKSTPAPLAKTPSSEVKPEVKSEGKPKRQMSAAGKKAIRAALKKRWAAFHEAEKVEPKNVPAKKKMSPARKAVLVANLAKARAAKAAKAKAGMA